VTLGRALRGAGRGARARGAHFAPGRGVRGAGQRPSAPLPTLAPAIAKHGTYHCIVINRCIIEPLIYVYPLQVPFRLLGLDSWPSPDPGPGLCGSGWAVRVEWDVTEPDDVAFLR
jgi:hypothetical protein